MPMTSQCDQGHTSGPSASAPPPYRLLPPAHNSLQPLGPPVPASFPPDVSTSVDTSHANAITYLSSGDAAMKRGIHGATCRAPMQTDVSLILDCDELASSDSLSPDHYLRHNAKFSRGQAQSGAPSPRPDPHPSDGHLPATGTAAACRRLLARQLLSRVRPRAQQSAKLRTVTRHSRIDSAFRRLMAPVDAILADAGLSRRIFRSLHPPPWQRRPRFYP